MNSSRGLLFTVLFCVGIMIPQEVTAQSEKLIGLVNVEEIVSSNRIYEIYINRYEPDSGAVKYLSESQDSVKIFVFFGDWCRESAKYIPGLMKTLRLADTDFIEVEYIGVDHQKKNPESFLKKFDIEYIPTVLVLKGDKELGRIKEKPHQLIEADLVQILKSGNEKKE